jgi:CRP-like cAMP-binding protein
MTRTHFAEGEVLFREGDPPDNVFRLLSCAVEIFRELDGERLLGTVGSEQFIGEMGVVENRPAARQLLARAADRCHAASPRRVSRHAACAYLRRSCYGIPIR